MTGLGKGGGAEERPGWVGRWGRGKVGLGKQQSLHLCSGPDPDPPFPPLLLPAPDNTTSISANASKATRLDDPSKLTKADMRRLARKQREAEWCAMNRGGGAGGGPAPPGTHAEGG